MMYPKNGKNDKDVMELYHGDDRIVALDGRRILPQHLLPVMIILLPVVMVMS